MIDPIAFNKSFRSLCARFRTPYDADQADAYFDFLDEQMDTADFLAAARAIWATAKWFPRPCDFLTVAMSDEWRLLTKCLDAYHAPEWGHRDLWNHLSPRSQEAVKRIGGLDAAKALMGKDALRLKSGFETAYEQVAASEVLALPAPRVSALPAA